MTVGLAWHEGSRGERGHGIEARAARDAADMVIAEDDGVVTELDGRVITVEYKKLGKKVAIVLSERLARSPSVRAQLRRDQRVAPHPAHPSRAGTATVV